MLAARRHTAQAVRTEKGAADVTGREGCQGEKVLRRKGFLQYGLSWSLWPPRGLRRLRNILAEAGEGARSTPQPPPAVSCRNALSELYTTEVAVSRRRSPVPLV